MKEVLIIGAGITGLTIARTLLEKGDSVTLVEARDRVGGRIHSVHSKFSRVVDLGPEFIHGNLPLTFKLLKEANQEKKFVEGRFYTISKDELEKGDMLHDHWKKLLQELNKLKTDITMADFLQLHFSGSEYAALRERVKRFAEGFDIADVNRVSSIALREEWSNSDDEHQYHLENSYGSLIDFLKDKVISLGGKIVLSEPVTEIEWKKNKVSVIARNGNSFQAGKVVVTIPLGVLQKKLIRFTPALPDHERAIESMGFGGVIKFLFEFNEAFWESSKTRKLKDLAFVFSDAEIPTWWSQLPDKTPLLTGWFSGPRTFESTHTPELLYAKAIKSLAYIFKCEAREIESALVHWHIADWVQDEFSFGAYSYPTLESSAARKILSLPVMDTLYFAGEALYDGPDMGTVEAALSSAAALLNTIDSINNS